MKLIEIDKIRYRHRLNRVIIAFIAGLTLLSVGFGSLLIWLFTESSLGQITTTDVVDVNQAPVSNFKYNLIGVILALFSCAAVLNRVKTSLYFYEIYYVWRIKQLHNLIFRRLKKIKQAAEQDQLEALIILTFYYQSLEQIYLLDDNTLTMSSLKDQQNKLKQQLEQKNLNISTDQFDKAMLLSYS